jgi:hypothetical protein
MSRAKVVQKGRRQGKKNRGWGRNKAKCVKYSLQHRHEKSHIRRIRRHIAVYKDSSDAARAALARYEEALHR